MADNIVPDHQTYMQQLQDIWFGQWGSENRSPIHTAAGMLQDAFDTDISEELATIASATKGEDMRVAIHDALYKLDQVRPGPPTPPEESVKVSDLYSTGSMVSGDGVIAPIAYDASMGPDYKWDAIGRTLEDGYSDLQISAEASGLAMVILVANQIGAAGIVAETGWTLAYSGTLHSTASRVVYIYTKPVSSGDTVSAQLFKNSGSSYMAFASLCIQYGATSFNVVSETEWTASTFSPDSKTDKRRLYVTTTKNTQSYLYVEVVYPSDYGELDLKRLDISNYLFLHQDYQNDVQVTPDLNYYGSFSTNTVVTLTIDILEG